jgi:hypothetical protein
VQQFKEADNNADTNHQPMFRNGTAANKYFYGILGAGNFKLISKRKLGFSIR